jgi:hypothetical protein
VKGEGEGGIRDDEVSVSPVGRCVRGIVSEQKKSLRGSY